MNALQRKLRILFLQSHLTGIEIGNVLDILNEGWDLQSHLTGIEMYAETYQSRDQFPAFNRTSLELKWSWSMVLYYLEPGLQSHLTGIEMIEGSLLLAEDEFLQSHLTGIEIKTLLEDKKELDRPSIAPHWNWNKPQWPAV